MAGKASKLQSIQVDVQRAVDAISSSLNLETEIVDDDLTIIAGTGAYKERVGLKEEEGNPLSGYIYGRVLTSGKAEISEDASNDPRYDSSVQDGTTKELAEACYPIISKGKVLGVIGLVAFNREQQRLLVEQKEQLLGFLNSMAELLASKAVESDTLKNMIVVSNQLRTIIESIDNGVLAVDNSGIVTHCNQNGANLIRKNKRQIIGHHILNIWAGSPIMDVLSTGVGYDWREESYLLDNQTMNIMVTVKPFFLDKDVKGVVATFRDTADIRKKAYEIMVTVPRAGIEAVFGVSPQIGKLRRTIELVAQNNSNVLIMGETGTGKGLTASAIHNSGPRLIGPFISVNCSAIPDTLLESELFGYTEGAFTGAKKPGKPGKFELAAGGTIFLDEIGDLPLRLQPKLLHVIQTKKVERLGGQKSIPVDARIIASTNRNLEKMIVENEFRQDLFFRLNVIPITIYPLRHRKEDIMVLAEQFLIKYSDTDANISSRFSNDLRDLFMNYDWPGNARELENAVEYMVSMAPGDVWDSDSAPPRIKRESLNKPSRATSLEEILEMHEKQILQRKLAEIEPVPGAKKKLAAMLMVSQATLYRKLKKYSLI